MIQINNKNIRIYKIRQKNGEKNKRDYQIEKKMKDMKSIQTTALKRRGSCAPASQ